MSSSGTVAECKICGHLEGVVYSAREMMFGIRDRFSYLECRACGCLQLIAPPADLSPYYPQNYYSIVPERGRARWLDAARDLRNRYVFTGSGLAGRLLASVSPYPLPQPSHWLTNSRCGPDSRILDVGCGSGKLLSDLARVGFRNLTGVDPMIESDLRPFPGVTVVKGTLAEIQGEFDLIMFHHSLEHIADQWGTFAAARERLSPGGTLLVRVPTVSSYAWQHYREDWVQIDAPRHFFLHSIESLRILGDRNGLLLQKLEFDSTELQFVGSELYRRDIPLVEGLQRVSAPEIRKARAEAEKLNRQGRGDQAVFYFSEAAA